MAEVLELQQTQPARLPVALASAPAAEPALAEPRVVVLSAATTHVERQVLARWLELEWGTVSAQTRFHIVDHRDPRLEDHLGAEDDPLVLPARVVWLPGTHGAEGLARIAADLLSLSNPWQPRPSDQGRIASQEPDRCRVVVGEAVRASELRRRWLNKGRLSRFGAYVSREATLALERAERAVIGHRPQDRRRVIEQLEARPRLQGALAAIARSSGRPLGSVKREAQACLCEMVTTQTPLGIELFYQQLGRVVAGLDLDVEAAQLEELRALGRHHALVFLPSHKSYVDPELLGRTLLRHGFPPNVLVGGVNLSFWPLSSLARRAGMMFIRRSFRDDPVYKAVLREYVRYLVHERFNLEWYIEGGRSRTGKLRLPRFGLLAQLADAVREEDEDVYLVPTAMAFEQLFELKAIVAEALGTSKTAESVQWLVEYLRSQYQSRGRVWLRFGRPMSLRASLEDEEAGVTGAGQHRDRAVQRIAFEVCRRINQAHPITPTSLVTLALLGIEDRALTLAEIGATLEPLLEYVTARRLPLVGGLAAADDAPLRDALGKLERQGVVSRFTEGTEPVHAIREDEHLVAAFYRNSAIHFFVNRSIVEIVLARAAERRLEEAGQALDAARRLRDLLEYEFILPRGDEFGAGIRGELELVDPRWQDWIVHPARAREMLESTHLHVAHRVLRSFLEAYQVVADHLAAQPAGLPFDEGLFLSQCLSIARQYRLQHRIGSTESISRELFGNAVAVARSRGLLEVGGSELTARRRELGEEVADHVAQIATIRDLALRDLRHHLRDRRHRRQGVTGWIDPMI